MVPKVSVIMPVFNGERYARAAIDSILAQSFRDFELIIINDGSSDGSAALIDSYSDPRIGHVNNGRNTGLANVRNKGLGIARGEYIAWLDCDDISLPRRLEKQVILLDRNPHIGLCGTWVRTLDGPVDQVWRYPTDPQFLRARMLFDDPLATSSIMMRAACCMEGQGLRFNVDHPPAEDYELWERVTRKWMATNIPEALTLYRIHSAQTSIVKAEKQQLAVWAVQKRMLDELAVDPTEDEKRLHLDIGVRWCFEPSMERLMASEAWLLKLEAANRFRKVFPENAFRSVLAERWALAAMGAAPNGIKTWLAYRRSVLSQWAQKRLWRLARVFSSCVWHGRR